ncbi:MAG: zinc ribbon domain-containing protein [Anaerolineaceae bacterium]|nr:zinc ribbon domain-containing protein [Anaerolineaceae bacterium]
MIKQLRRIPGYRTHMLLGLMFLILLTYNSVQAQSASHPYFEKVSVTLHPEFKQPAILISYVISLPDSSSIPSEVVINLPEGVHNLESLTELTSEHELDLGEYEIILRKDSTELHFKPPSKEFVVTFFDVNLVKDGTVRSYIYNWKSPYKVNDFDLRVIRTAGASEVATQPELSINIVDSNGIEYYEDNFGKVEAGETFSLELSYKNELGDVNNPAHIVVPGDPIDSHTAGKTPLPNSLMLALLSIAFTGVLGLLIFFSLRFAAVRKKKVINAVLPTDEQTNSPRPYCLDCGQHLKSDDRFCRSCGAVLR